MFVGFFKSYELFEFNLVAKKVDVGLPLNANLMTLLRLLYAFSTKENMNSYIVFASMFI